jgi:RNA polymerase sigma-70 factor, ECF subfamily
VDLRDPAAFQTVYAAHSRRVYANAYRILGDAAKAEDTVQDVFLRLWLHPDRFDERRGELGSYLALMARSRALDIARSESAGSRASERFAAIVEADPPQAERPDERVEAQDLAARLRTAVNRLPKLQREAVALAFWGDLPAREIAQRTGVPLGTARSRLRLGIEKLGRAAIDGAQA